LLRSSTVLIVVVVTTLTSAQTYKVARTPWGDPDLTGTYVNDNEYATPLERPEPFAGRRREDVKPGEYQARARDQAIAGLAPGPRGPDDWWLSNLDLARRSHPWLIVDPPDGRIPALTPAGKVRASQRVRSGFVGGPFDSPSDLNSLERCITRGVPGSMIPVMYGNSYVIAQSPGVVVITYEIVHEARVIPLDGRPRLNAAIRQHMGDSRGRFDGDTLVVETTSFRAGNNMGGYFRYADENLRLTERFTRVDADTLRYEFTVDDPTVWARPWTAAIYWKKSNGEIYEYACHEGNYSLSGMLSALRAEEAEDAR